MKLEVGLESISFLRLRKDEKTLEIRSENRLIVHKKTGPSSNAR